jgi:hypothetical protein
MRLRVPCYERQVLPPYFGLRWVHCYFKYLITATSEVFCWVLQAPAHLNTVTKQSHVEHQATNQNLGKHLQELLPIDASHLILVAYVDDEILQIFSGFLLRFRSIQYLQYLKSAIVRAKLFTVQLFLWTVPGLVAFPYSL